MKKRISVVLLCTWMIILAWGVKYRANYNYLDSNATWHVLFTINAYDKTPVSVHKFLPIVSWGNPLDKGIQWAEMVSDSYGNYYYTSFSPAGFALPYFFLKIFHLPANELGIYIFNLVLCVITALLCMKLFCDMFSNRIPQTFICLWVTLLFAFQTEILQCMGIVYWHQSITQLLLAWQFLNYFHFKDGKKWKIMFFFVSLLMPYVEWTGCIANVGFAFALFLSNGIRMKWKNFLWAFLTGVCTAMSLGLLAAHYLSVIEWGAFLQALQDRYMMRTYYAYATWFNLFWGYWKSFKTLWVLLVVLFVASCIVNGGMKWILSYKSMIGMLFVMIFPLLENVVMKEHAISYTYDRMKLVYPLLLVAMIFLAAILEKMAERIAVKKLSIVITVFLTVLAAYNVWGYTTNRQLLWKAEYRVANEKIASHCKEQYYEDSVYGMDGAAVRGYMNMLFERGIYENVTKEELLDIAKQADARYAVYITPSSNPSPDNCFGMYAIDYVTIIDLRTMEERTIYE